MSYKPPSGQPCSIADLIRALSQHGIAKWLVDIDGQLPLAALRRCAPARPIRWGTEQRLASNGGVGAQVMQVVQKPCDPAMLSPVVLSQSVVHLTLPDPGLGQSAALEPWVRAACQHVPFGIVTMPLSSYLGAQTTAHEALASILETADLGQPLLGHHALFGFGDDAFSPHALALVGSHAVYRPAPPKRVLALLSTFNDIDMIVDTLEHLWAQGVDVHVVDNWSTDGTWGVLEEMRRAAPARMVGLERYPDRQADTQYDWHGILARKEAIAQQAGYDWYLHYDSDELRLAPWPGVTLAEAISRIDALGYNAIDHTLIDFRPTEDGFDAQSRAETFFKHFSFNPRPGAFSQVKGWAAQPGPVHLNHLGGHAVQFAGRRVFPLKFLLKHYPLRSSDQARRKIYTERLPRFAQEQASRGWHGHYRPFVDHADATFMWDPQTLETYEAGVFEQAYLVERLFGLGYTRETV